MKKVFSVTIIVTSILIVSLVLLKDKYLQPSDIGRSVDGDMVQQEEARPFVSPPSPTQFITLTKGERFLQTEESVANYPLKADEMPLEAEVLEDLQMPEARALEALHELLHICAYNGNHGQLVTGFTNVEVTNGLLGNNAKKRAFLSSQHPRINPYGELVDKWETPYEFHFLGARKVEIFSAGPDQELYTDDDVALKFSTD